MRQQRHGRRLHERRAVVQAAVPSQQMHAGARDVERNASGIDGLVLRNDVGSGRKIERSAVRIRGARAEGCKRRLHGEGVIVFHAGAAHRGAGVAVQRENISADRRDVREQHVAGSTRAVHVQTHPGRPRAYTGRNREMVRSRCDRAGGLFRSAVGNRAELRRRDVYVWSRPRDCGVPGYVQRSRRERAGIETRTGKRAGNRRISRNAQVSSERQSERGDVVAGARRGEICGKNHVILRGRSRDLGAGDLDLVAPGRGIKVVIADAVGLKWICGCDAERGVGVNRRQRRARRAGGRRLAHAHRRTRNGMARGPEYDVIFARSLRIERRRGQQQRQHRSKRHRASCGRRDARGNPRSHEPRHKLCSGRCREQCGEQCSEQCTGECSGECCGESSGECCENCRERRPCCSACGAAPAGF